MKTQSVAELTLMTAKPRQVTRRFVSQSPDRVHPKMGEVAPALSREDCAAATLESGWIQRLKQNFLKFKKRPPHLYALQDENPSVFEPFAELFLLVMDDSSIRPLVRIWYARLQWPVIQLASADPIGFQEENHPARRLIVSLGGYALGKGEFELPCGLLEQEAKRLVLLIESFPLADRDVFELACKEFDAFLENTRNKPPVVDCSVCLQEQHEAMTAQFQKAILDRLFDAPVGNAIREFVTQVWAKILSAHAVRQGLEHSDTLKLKQAGFELIQISTDLLSLSERKTAIAKVPQLMQQLRRGMSWMGIGTEEQDGHIHHIGNDLSDAFMSRPPAVSADRPAKLGLIPKVRRTAVDGLLVSDENTDFDWYLWECALTEQTSGDPAEREKLADIFALPFQDTTNTSQDFWGAYPGDSL